MKLCPRCGKPDHKKHCCLLGWQSNQPNQPNLGVVHSVVHNVVHGVVHRAGAKAGAGVVRPKRENRYRDLEARKVYRREWMRKRRAEGAEGKTTT